MATRLVGRVAVAVVVLAACAFAQTYPGGTTMPGVYTAPSGGYKSSTGIAIGSAAAAGVAVGYLVMHNRGSLSGCLVSGDNGQMELRRNKSGGTYMLRNDSSVSLKTGERVRLKGKKVHDGSGQNMFDVHGLAKDYGACS
jgi:hypothetical protein